ncbi:MAG: class I SAM-dependent methyltransferase [Candidatus Scalindua sp.]|nr:class I SAM-dependent methyltransferase [Candidatus Scalindua sp.]
METKKENLIQELIAIAESHKSETGKKFEHLDNIMGAARFVKDAFLIQKTVKEKSCVLDLGCGVGQMSYLLRRLDFDVIASDIYPGTPYYIEYYNRVKEGEVKYYECDILKNKKHVLSDKKFDAICISGVLEHVPDFRLFLDRMKALLRTNGKLFIFRFPHKGSWIEKINYLRFANAVSHPLRFSPKEIHFMLRWHGFRVDEWAYEEILPVNLRGLPQNFINMYHKIPWILMPASGMLCSIPFLNMLSTSFRFVCNKAVTKS